MKCAKLRSAGTRGAPWRHGTCGAASIRYLWSIDMTSLQSSFQKQFARLARYNHWMNERLYALAAQMSDEERKLDRGAFFKSIHGTLNHILLGDRIWLATVRTRILQIITFHQHRKYHWRACLDIFRAVLTDRSNPAVSSDELQRASPASVQPLPPR